MVLGAKNSGLMDRGQKIGVFHFLLHRPLRSGRHSLALAYRLGQVGLAAGNAIQPSAGGKAAWQRAFFDRTEG